MMEDGQPFGFGNRLHFDPPSTGLPRTTPRGSPRCWPSGTPRHPALAMWHVSNEYGPTAYTPSSAVAFRSGSGTDTATSTRSTTPGTPTSGASGTPPGSRSTRPRCRGRGPTRARRLDFQRFCSDALLECFVMERDIVRSYRDDIPVLTNFMRFYRHADYWRWAAERTRWRWTSIRIRARTTRTSPRH